MAISHIFTNPVPDGTITSIVRPSDWNSAHNQYYTLSGNVLGASTVSGTNVVLQAGTNISLSGTGQTIVIQGTNTPQPTSYVSNVNGSSGAISLNVASSLSASTNGSSITFGLASNITTALQSANANYLTSQSNQAFSASGGSSTFQTLNFANSNGVTFSNSGGSIVASYTVPTQSVQTQASGNIVGSGFTSTTTTGTAVVGTLNSSGLSLGVPAFITAGGVGGNFSGGVSNLGNTAGSTGITGTRVVFVGTNNISLSQSTDANGATISINQTGGGGGGIAAAAGGQTATSGTVNFANSNGITFGMSQSSQITASYTVPTSYVSNVNGSSGQISLNVGSSLSASTNGSSITLGLVTDITTALQSANANYLTSQSNQAFSASGGSSTFQTLNFANSNGVTFSNTNGSVRITHDLQFTSNTSAITANAFPSADTTKFAGTGTTAVNATVTLNSNGINISVAPPGAANYSIGVSNLGNTAGSTGITGTRIVFVGTNNISLSQSTDANGATISINQTGGGGGAMYANLSGATSGNTTASGSTLNFSGINVTLSGTNASQIAISAPATTALVAGNNISLSANANTLSVLAQAVAVSAGSQLATSGTLLFSDANGVTFGMNGSSRITASYTQRTTYAFSASGGSSSWATLNFANSNGITFTNTNASVAIAHDLQYTSNTSNITSNAFPSADTTKFAGTGTTAVNATVTLNSNGINISVAPPGAANYSIGVSNLGNTAGSTGITGTRVVFVGTNNISLSQSTDANGATISINQTGGGGGNFSGGVSNLGNTAGSTGITGTRIVFVGTNNISLSQSTDANGATISINQTGGGAGNFNLSGATSGNTTATGNTINLSGINITLSGTNNSQIAISAPATSSLVGAAGISISSAGSTISVLNNYLSSFENVPLISTLQAMTLNLQSVSHAVAFNLPEPLSASFIRIPVFMATNSTTIATSANSNTGGAAIFSTFNAVIYSLGTGGNSRSLQSVASGSAGYTFSNSISVAANGSQYSLSQGYSAQAQGGGTTLTTQTSASTSNYSFANGSFSDFSNFRFLDIPFTSSLAPGAYWFVFGGTTSSGATTGNAAFSVVTNCNVRYQSHYGVPSVNIAFGVMGSSNLTSGGFFNAGSFSTAGGGTTNSINISQISSSGSNVRVYFQMLRSA